MTTEDIKTVQNQNKNGFNKIRFREGEDVLVAAEDKKEYSLGTIKVVRPFDYLIKFDDATERWHNELTLRKLCSIQSYNRIKLCKDCRRLNDPAEFCDECHREYHWKCSNKDHDQFEKRLWDCNSCKETTVRVRSIFDDYEVETKEIFTNKSKLPYNVSAFFSNSSGIVIDIQLID